MGNKRHLALVLTVTGVIIGVGWMHRCMKVSLEYRQEQYFLL